MPNGTPLPETQPKQVTEPQASQEQMQGMMQQLLTRALQPRRTGPTPQPETVRAESPRPKYDPNQSLVRGVLSTIMNHSAIEKQKQLDHATGRLHGLSKAIERSYDLAQDEVNKGTIPQEQLEQRAMQHYQDSFEFKSLQSKEGLKDLKQMQKLMQMDFMDPEKKRTVWHEALERVAKLSGAEKVMKAIKGAMGKHQDKMAGEVQKQGELQKGQAQAREFGQEMFKGAGVQPTDPKVVEQAVTQARLAQEHEETLGFRRQQAQQNFDMQKMRLDERRSEIEQRLQDRALDRQERERHNREMEGLRREYNGIVRDKAQMTGDAGDWADLVAREGLKEVPASQRRAVLSYMNENNMSVPTPLNASEQKTMDDTLETSSKIDGWLMQLDKFKDAQGNLPNKPFTMFSGTLAYYAGVNTPEAALISDFSRERWQAIGPLLHGVRRGDIIKSITRHTPDPFKDSVSLMYTKLQKLKGSFDAARSAVLKEHGFDIDPATGQELEPPEPDTDEFGAKPVKEPKAKAAAPGKKP